MTLSYACILLAFPSPCQPTTAILNLQPFITDRYVIASNFPVAPILMATVPTHISPSLKFSFQPISGQTNSLKLTLKMNRAAIVGNVFRAMIYFPSLAERVCFKVTVFGQVVVETETTAEGEIDLFPIYVSSYDQTQNVVEIELTGDTSTSGTLAFAVEKIENVINEAGECVNTCVEKTGFETGLEEGSGTLICAYCETSLFFEADHINGGCRCFDHYYNNAGVCTPCDDPLCKECSSSGTVCDVCIKHADKDTNGMCVCREDYYAKDGECLECPFQCKSCNDGTSCEECLENQNTRGSPAAQCPCASGFYEDGVNVVCPKCALECATC